MPPSIGIQGGGQHGGPEGTPWEIISVENMVIIISKKNILFIWMPKICFYLFYSNTLC